MDGRTIPQDCSLYRLPPNGTLQRYCGPPYQDYVNYTTVDSQTVPTGYLNVEQTLALPDPSLPFEANYPYPNKSYMVATSSATATAMDVTPETATVSQSKSLTFQATNISGTSVNWCVLWVSGHCGYQETGQGTLTVSGNNATYTAPSVITANSNGNPVGAYVCAEENGNSANDFCAAIVLTGCPTPTITSVSPSTWFAGRTYKDVKITGTNFITADKATAACPETAISITAADGSTVATSALRVKSATEITATVKPPVDAATETATITAGTSPNTGKYSDAQILGNQIICSGANMQCNGDIISATGDSDPQLQEVVVGQPISLKSFDLPTGVTATETTWKVGGTNIGGYAVASDFSSATVTATELKNATLSTYWIYPQKDVRVTYKYCVDIAGLSAAEIKGGLNCSRQAKAAFNISGPTGKVTFAMNPSLDTWNVRPIYDCDTKKKIYDLVFGWRNLDSSTCGLSAPLTTGINFTGEISNEPSTGGAVSWVQVISADTFSGVTPSGSTKPYTQGPGLDNKYPYPPTDPDVPSVTHDSPAIALISDYLRETRTFTAKMYLLWTSKTDGSIPIPLGYVKWKISGTGVYQPNHPSPWPWNVVPGATKTANFSASSDTGTPYYGMPHWTKVLLNTQGDKLMSLGTESVQTDEEEENQ